MNILILVAGGSGQRMGQDIPKQFLFVEDKPIIVYTLEKFQSSPLIDRIYVACLEGWEIVLNSYAKQFNITKLSRVFKGGENRFESINNVLRGIENEVCDDDIIMTYDANRPLIGEDMIEDSINKCKEFGGAAGARPCNESMFRGKNDGFIKNGEDRSTLYIGTGPDSAPYGVVRKLFDEKPPHLQSPTLCELMLAANMDVAVSKSSSKCIKLTTVDDIEIFRALLYAKNCSWIKS